MCVCVRERERERERKRARDRYWDGVDLDHVERKSFPETMTHELET